MARAAEHRRAGGEWVSIVEGARATSIAERAGRTRVRTTIGDFDADAAVIAAGAGSRELQKAVSFAANFL
ncbi:hypothetical protein Atai01_81650 [Amycolatopsis taiwanensis]|uniref:Uncharacterized protein n=1 Tax=Amycolatopsis taiwanensis TaxID=342230 RepID=A0A9W6R8Z9_9PSEU|nr:hypothetical protein Atai01_81650 [Amycolatopsis taiwanensis]